ncbi:MAG: iron-sulfur cluster assembly accessory protein [Alphaproteobacteria bacterium]|nr:MAG: iron-sulfur cluster assembly accessory protein [Alphaproteobacteria bacterium]
MFGIPGKSPVTLTPAAAAQIRKLMGGDKFGLRIGLKKGGCAGMEYTMEYVDAADPADEVVEQDGARVLIAPMAQMFLFGTEIDYKTSLLESGFVFNNPNVVEACGCGESIRFETG